MLGVDRLLQSTFARIKVLILEQCTGLLQMPCDGQGQIPGMLQVVTQEEAEALQSHGQLVCCEQTCGHSYGITKAAVQAVQYQDKVSLTTQCTPW